MLGFGLRGMTVEGGNVSVIGRLLEEISWEGSRVKQYGEGGRGLENVLTAEVLLPLTYFPRGPFPCPGPAECPRWD